MEMGLWVYGFVCLIMRGYKVLVQVQGSRFQCL